MYAMTMLFIGLIFLGYVCPDNVVQAEGLNATFLCQHPTDSGTIEWIINGTRFRGVSGDDMIVIEGHANATEAVKIRALPQFNGTKVVCALYIIEPNGTLTVRGQHQQHSLYKVYR